ncbi:MAG: helix-turn-helix domain-containing protein [Deltaproteobacteria bacterium]|nr:helix-turn-helix domain-containing protein [Deltaproteobacteria bacterium]
MKSLSPAELQSLLTTDVDIVDVREPDEWSTGHVPGARLVPLGLLRADPLGALPRDKVVFVCAKGGRSAQASAVAEGVGRATVYSLNGGTDAWRAAGLPIVVPGPTTTRATTATESAPESAPEPGLDAVVGDNLKRERAARGWSLDELAREAGISRTLLGQIELGRATPSIGVVWKIAAALGVHFATLLSQPAPRIGTTLSKRESAKKLTSADGRVTSRALFPPGDAGAAEFYELWLAPHSREDAEAHRPGTRENLIVASGRLELKIGSETLQLHKGDAVNFAADQPHSYVNLGSEECWLYLVMNYATR